MKGKRISYNALEMAWIEANAQLPRQDLHRLFVAKFNRGDVSCSNIKALCTRKRWLAGPDGKRRNAGKSLIFTPEQCDWLRSNGTLSRSELAGAFHAAHPTSSATLAQLVAWRKRNGVKTGRDGRFKKGHTPWTKGRKIGSHPNSAKTQFKKGQTPHNAMPIGTERVNEDGYVLICVDRPNPYTGARTHMAFKHRELWEAQNGPVPPHHVLKCLDGDKTNCDPANWECLPTGMLSRLNGKSGRNYDAAPKELKPTIMAIAQLEHAARNAKSK